jgi:DNA mismatch repair protein MutS
LQITRRVGFVGKCIIERRHGDEVDACRYVDGTPATRTEAPGAPARIAMAGRIATLPLARMTDTAAGNDLSPAMRQYQAVKARYPDCIIFFRIGDFYEMFYDDARTAARVLGLALTARSKTENAVPMAGVPHHAVEGYLARMLEAGFRVAVVEQLEDPRVAKGVIKRDVVRLITPGTLTDETLLRDNRPNYLAAVALQEGKAGLAWVEMSTGEFAVAEPAAGELADELARIQPAECLISDAQHRSGSTLPGFTGTPPFLLTPRSDWIFAPEPAATALCGQFQTRTLEGFGFAAITLGLCAAGAIVDYLKETQRTRTGHIRPPRPVVRGHSLLIDPTTLRGLEVVQTLRAGEQAGSLLSAIDRTRTAMGARLLRNWVLFPAAALEPIRLRQQAVAELVENAAARKAIRERLGEVADIERIIGRINCGRASPRDLLGLGRSLAALGPIGKELGEPTGRLLAELTAQLADAQTRGRGDTEAATNPQSGLAVIVCLIRSAIRDDAPAALKDGGIIRDGFHAELDRLRDITRNGQKWLAEFQAAEVARTGIPSLKVGFNQVFGYYIEITHTHKDKVPADYVRRQTVRNAERYITDDLKKHETEVLTAEDRIKQLEFDLFEQVRVKIAAETPVIQRAAAAAAQIDVLAGLAQLAVERRYVRPELVEEPVLDIAEGRHPVLEQTLAEKFVPNDTALDERECRLALITGPNMAGKSTYIRQTALLVLLAHTGSFVPAGRAVIGLADRIFARVGASDDITRGRSTFMVEMTETANILNNATRRSVVILDEIGRGTSTFDGLSLAWALTEHIVANIGCRTLFATHYHELTELAAAVPGIRNFNVAVREWQDEIVFLHRIVAGGTDKSYGLHVARLAGIPREVLERARQVLRELEGTARRSNATPTGSGDTAAQAAGPADARRAAPVTLQGLARTAGRKEREQMLLFEDLPHPLLEKLRKLKLETLTPLQSMNLLKELQDQVLGDSE